MNAPSHAPDTKLYPHNLNYGTPHDDSLAALVLDDQEDSEVL